MRMSGTNSISDKEITLSAEELLSLFNRNITINAELLDYIAQKNVFGIIGKERNEGVHSRFIAELLSGSFFDNASRESTLQHFLDLLLYRADKEKKGNEVGEHLRKAVLTRSVLFDKMESKCELTIKKYQEKEKISAPKNSNYTDDDRIDIYLKFKLSKSVAQRKELEIFIENKVYSPEFKNQTQKYHDACHKQKNDRQSFQLFVYLTPQSIRDLDHYDKLQPELKPTCKNYIHICYQDIMDYVIEPLSKNSVLDANKRLLVNEYISCLELPAMPDAETELPSKRLTIMAIGDKEKRLVHSFMQDAINQRVVNKSIEAKLGGFLFSVKFKGTIKGTLFNYREAFQHALQIILNDSNNPLEVLKQVNKCGIIGLQGGPDPFLIYSPESWRSRNNKYSYLPYNDLYVYSQRVFVSISDALSAALVDFQRTTGKPNPDLIECFKNIYSQKGNGIPLVSDKRQADYQKTDINGIFVRKDIKLDRLQNINRILGSSSSIIPIDSKSYMELMECCIPKKNSSHVSGVVLGNKIQSKLKEVNTTSHYEQVGTTNFFFRNDKKERILNLNNVTIDGTNYKLIEKCDSSTLCDFFKNRRNLILSIYKILLEEETDNTVYNEKLCTLNSLLQS